MLSSVALTPDQPGFLQHPKVSRDRRQGHAKWLGQGRDAHLTTSGKPLQDAEPRWIGQRGKNNRHCPFVNQRVKYTRAA